MPDDNVAAIRRLYDALAARDASVIQELAPDAVNLAEPRARLGRRLRRP
jgi:hypothetical protein